ncbi:MAG TPA: hypothetical protein VJS19_05780 [Candidatus Dormibacteraeota bacterium]|nr:hypothetical protein [Candidatus Dormibacteraeota bacterium]
MIPANLPVGMGDVPGVAVFSNGRSWAAVGVLTAAAGLAVLPALAASGIGTGAIARAAAALGFVVVIGGGVKAVAVILGAAGLVRRPRDWVLAAPSD